MKGCITVQHLQSLKHEIRNNQAIGSILFTLAMIALWISQRICWSVRNIYLVE